MTVHYVIEPTEQIHISHTVFISDARLQIDVYKRKCIVWFTNDGKDAEKIKHVWKMYLERDIEFRSITDEIQTRMDEYWPIVFKLYKQLPKITFKQLMFCANVYFLSKSNDIIYVDNDTCKLMKTLSCNMIRYPILPLLDLYMDDTKLTIREKIMSARVDACLEYLKWLDNAKFSEIDHKVNSRLWTLKEFREYMVHFMTVYLHRLSNQWPSPGTLHIPVIHRESEFEAIVFCPTTLTLRDLFLLTKQLLAVSDKQTLLYIPCYSSNLNDAQQLIKYVRNYDSRVLKDVIMVYENDLYYPHILLAGETYSNPHDVFKLAAVKTFQPEIIVCDTLDQMFNEYKINLCESYIQKTDQQIYLNNMQLPISCVWNSDNLVNHIIDHISIKQSFEFQSVNYTSVEMFMNDFPSMDDMELTNRFIYMIKKSLQL